MATLKGQNVRILLYDTTASKYKVGTRWLEWQQHVQCR